MRGRAADLTRSCASGWLSLTSKEPPVPRWLRFKEQLMISNARSHTGARRSLPSLPWTTGLPAEDRVAAAQTARSF